MSATINRSTVKLGRDENDLRKVAIIVQVKSDRPGLKATHAIDPGMCASAKDLAAAVGAAGAVCAEHLCRKYNDQLDPYACSRDAILALGEEMRMLAELSKDQPEKVRRLAEHRQELSSAAGAKIDLWAWTLRQGNVLTAVDNAEINDMIAQLHGAQLG